MQKVVQLHGKKRHTYRKSIFPKKRKLLIILCLLTFTVAELRAQQVIDTKKVDLSLNNVTLKSAFQTIQKTAGVNFAFSQDFDKYEASRISLIKNDISLKSALDALLKNTDLSYAVIEDQIVIKAKGASNQSTNTVRRTSAQQRGSINGKVEDEYGAPLTGATIKVLETDQTIRTDGTGDFNISIAPGSYSLRVSYLSYIPKDTLNIKVTENETSTILFKLTKEVGDLDEVVVVGYGVQKKASVIGAISTLSPQNIKAPVAKISSQLAGQLSGILAIQRSGEPGTGSTFWIRGISTFSGSATPLVLVDGVERSMDLVDPEDVKEFSILKDAAATAVYGVRGANGVVLITTRTGEAGKPKISIKAERGTVAPTRVPEMINSLQYAEMYNDAVGYAYYTPDIMEAFKTGSDPVLYPDVDWVGELYKKSSLNNRLNANASGGSNTVRYFVSGGYYDENGLFISDNMNEYNTSVYYKQFRFRSNLDIDIAKYTTVNINLATSFERKNEPGTGGATIWQYALQTPSNAFPMVFPNGYLPGPGQNQGYNPYSLLTQTGYVEKFWNNAQSLFGITQDFSEYITKGLRANVKLSFDALNYSALSRTRTTDQWIVNRNTEGELEYNQLVKGAESLTYSEGRSGRRLVYIEGSLNYARTFDQHSVSALFLYQQSQRNNIGVSTSVDALAYRNQGIAGRLAYDYDQRYFIEGNFGYNGSENFSRGNRFGLFPSVAAGWMISNEKFFQPVTPIVDLLKLRISYGLVGNDQIGANRRFVYLSTIENGGNFSFGESATSYSSIRLGDWANENVGWETSRKLDVGIEVSFFRKLKIQADYFKENRSGIFLQRQAIPMYTGLINNPWVNIGKMRNGGMDASVEYRHRLGDVHVTARGNFTHARNVIIDQDQPNWEYLYQNRRGQARYQRFGYVAVGLFENQTDIDSWADQSTIGGAQPGDIKYLDLNGDGIINSYDQKAIGYTDIPETIYGFGGSVGWKNFDFSIFLQGNANVEFSMRSSMTQAFISANKNQSNVFADIYDNYWTPERTDAKYPRLTSAANSNNDVSSTFWLVDGSYVRVKNVEFGYTLPKSISKRIHSNDIRFYFSGVNMFTFSKFKLWDPDLQTGASTYPMNKVYNIGLSMGF